ncbi:hypothetical protein SLOPH_692 [Spraguea lophii 42_110]|uniref:Uncharacterized protein n=1 Tax=Spraguea lophii (strain 42_110) TaxID=1358809 RepID=S7WD11_SPRLO|nr:hypothetical protein SLOPH_692 [Spraguea lophii 42_110]
MVLKNSMIYIIFLLYICNILTMDNVASTFSRINLTRDSRFQKLKDIWNHGNDEDIMLTNEDGEFWLNYTGVDPSDIGIIKIHTDLFFLFKQNEAEIKNKYSKFMDIIEGIKYNIWESKNLKELTKNLLKYFTQKEKMLSYMLEKIKQLKKEIIDDLGLLDDPVSIVNPKNGQMNVYERFRANYVTTSDTTSDFTKLFLEIKENFERIKMSINMVQFRYDIINMHEIGLNYEVKRRQLFTDLKNAMSEDIKRYNNLSFLFKKHIIFQSEISIEEAVMFETFPSLSKIIQILVEFKNGEKDFKKYTINDDIYDYKKIKELRLENYTLNQIKVIIEFNNQLGELVRDLSTVYHGRKYWNEREYILGKRKILTKDFLFPSTFDYAGVMGLYNAIIPVTNVKSDIIKIARSVYTKR